MEAPPDLWFLLVRIVGFVLLLSAAGSALFLALFGRLLSATSQAITRLSLRFALAAALIRILQQALEAARMSGEMSGMLDPAMQQVALRSPAGASFALGLIGLLLLASGAATRSRWAGPLGAVTVTLAFSVTGHTVVSSHHFAAGVLLSLHVLVVAFWIGSLWPLYIASSGETPEVSGRVLEAFSTWAVWLIPVIALAGIGMTVLLVPDLAVFRQTYGRLLLAKVVLFSVLLIIATWNRYQLGPACATGDAQPFRRSVATEILVIAAVLAITAVMTTLFSPEAP